jgi:hypothetical protein
MNAKKRRYTAIRLYRYALLEGLHKAALAISLVYRYEYGRKIEIDII